MTCSSRDALARFLQRRLEGGHQIVRQVPDKAYGIRQHGIPHVRHVNAPQRRIGVANSWSAAYTSADVIRLNRVDLPALV